MISKLRNNSQHLFNTVKGIFTRYKYHLLVLVFIFFLITFITTSLTQTLPSPTPSPSPQPLTVRTFILNGGTGYLSTTAEVEDKDTITLVAQIPGPVKAINFSEGQSINKGSVILSQETGYTLGNAAGVGVKIAQSNLQLSETNLKHTIDSVNLARRAADQNRNNTDELRNISQQSQDATRKLIDTTKQVISQIETDINATSDTAIIQGLRQQLINYQNILINAETGLRSTEYSVNKDNPPTQLADIGKDQIYAQTQQQLDAAILSKQIAELNLQSARLQASLASVRSPITGTLDRVYVITGQYLQPGTPVAKITGNANNQQLVAAVSGTSAGLIKTQSLAQISFNDQVYSTPITHVTKQPSQGNLYEVFLEVPSVLSASLFDGQILPVTLNIIASDVLNTNTFIIPLESVYISSNQTYVYVLTDNQAQQRFIEIGSIIGDQIQVTSGLVSGDTIIQDRRVFSGQQVTAAVETSSSPLPAVTPIESIDTSIPAK